MELKINNTTVLDQVQSEFNRMYPYLKIEFAAKKEGKPKGKGSCLSPGTSIRQIMPIKHDVAINIDGYRTVADVERDFRDSIGLSIMLYRKSGNVWIETSLTDDWTLERQNQSGEILSFSS